MVALRVQAVWHAPGCLQEWASSHGITITAGGGKAAANNAFRYEDEQPRNILQVG